MNLVSKVEWTAKRLLRALFWVVALTIGPQIAHATTCELGIVYQYQSNSAGQVQYVLFNHGPDTCDANIAIGADDLGTYYLDKGWVFIDSNGIRDGIYSVFASNGTSATAGATCQSSGNFFLSTFIPPNQNTMAWRCKAQGFAPGESIVINVQVPQDHHCPAAAITSAVPSSAGFPSRITDYEHPEVNYLDGLISNNFQYTSCEPGSGQIPTTTVNFTKTTPTPTVALNSNVTFTIKAKNLGTTSQQAAQVTMLDQIPVGFQYVSATATAGSGTCVWYSGSSTVRCDTSSIGPLATAEYNITMKAIAIGTLTNTCSATGNIAFAGSYPITTNTSACVSQVVVSGTPALVATKTATASTVVAGAPIGWTVTVQNNGNDVANSVVVTDTLPPGLTNVTAAGPSWTCGVSGQTLTCTRPSISVGGSSSITVSANAPTSPGSITNTCVVTGTGATSDSTGCHVTTTVTAAATVTVTKTATPNPVLAGQPITWTLTAANAGPNPASNVVVTDTLPNGVTNIVASGSGWTCSVSGLTATCSRASLAVGSSAITITGKAPTTPGTITNTCVASGAPGVIFDVANCRATTTVDPSSDLKLSKVASASTLPTASPISWTITTNNLGPSTATNVVVSDAVPAGVTGISASGAGWSCSTSGQAVTCSRASLPLGSTTITINGTTPSTPGTITNTCTGTATTDPSVDSTACTAATTITPRSNVTVTKTATPNPVPAGNTITWTITATNSGPNAATNVSVVDTLPAGVTNIAAAGAGWACSVSGLTATCTRASLAVGSSAITITGKAPTVTGPITNTCVASADPGSIFDVTNCRATTTVSQNAQLVVSKTASASSLPAASPISWTINVANNGPTSASNVSIVDTVPAGVTAINASGSGWTCLSSGQVYTCNRATLAVGSSQIVISGKGPTSPGTITNTCTGSAAAGASVDSTACQASTIITAASNVTLTKVASPNPVMAGQPITWTITATNSGPNPATNVVVNDAIPAGVTSIAASGSGWACAVSGQNVSCSRASLPVGASSITITGNAPTTTGPITNTCVATGDTGVIFDVTNCRAITTVNPRSEITLSKVASAGTVPAGMPISWTITAQNAGPNDATNVVVNDAVPAGVTGITAAGTGWTCSTSGQAVTCTRATFPVGISSILISGTAPTTPGSITNTCTGTATTDPSVNSTACVATTTITARSTLVLSKTATPNTVPAGGLITWTITAQNQGPNTATNAVVTDTVPAGVTNIAATGAGFTCGVVGQSVSCSIASFPVGSKTITITGRAPSNGGQITNVCVGSADAGSTIDATACRVVTTVTDSSALSFTKAVSPNPVLAGNTVTWTITAHNAGPSSASNVVVDDAIPAGVTNIAAQWISAGAGYSCSVTGQNVQCQAASMPVGDKVIRITGNAPATPGPLENTCVASADLTSSIDVTDCHVTTVVQVNAHVVAVKEASDAFIGAGLPLSWTIHVSNSGPSDATNVTIVDTVPDGVTSISASGSGWLCTVNAQIVTCDRPVFSPGTSDITVDGIAPVTPGTIENTCTVATTDDPSADFSACRATTTVGTNAQVTVSKTATPNPVTAGGEITWTLNVNNAGPSFANNVVITDTIPAGVTNIAATSPDFACSIVGQDVICSIDPLLVGATTITITGNAPAEPGPIRNTCVASGEVADTSACDVTTVVTELADVEVRKIADAANVPAGAPIGWTIEVENHGPSMARNIVVGDDVPAGVTNVAATSADGFTCSVASNAVTCTIPQLPIGIAHIHVTGTAPLVAQSVVNTCAAVSDSTPPPDNAACTSTVIVDPNTGITVAKTASSPTVPAAGPMWWEITVSNAGPGTASNVVVDDPIPAGVTNVSASGNGWSCQASDSNVHCTRPDLGVASSVIRIDATAPTTLGPMTNTCVVDADAAPVGGTCEVTTVVVESATIVTRKTASASSIHFGDPISWTIEIVNNGPSEVPDLTIHDPLPAGTANAVAVSKDGWACTLVGLALDCTHPDPLPIGTTSIHISADAPDVAGTIVNTCSTTVGGSSSSVTVDDTACRATTEVVRSANVSVIKQAQSASVSAGAPIHWSLVVTNTGPTAATDLVITDTLPAGVTNPSAIGLGVPGGGSWSCAIAGGVVTCSVPRMEVGTSTIQIDASAPMVPGDITNTCVMEASTLPAPDDSGCHVTTTVTQAANVTVTKQSFPAQVVIGGAIDWVITVINQGPDVATNVSVVDTLPAGVTLQSVDGQSWTCTNNGATVTCSIASLPLGLSEIHVHALAPTTAGPIRNTCVVTAANVTVDDQCLVDTVVTGEPHLRISKSVTEAQVVAGGPVEWLITVTNDGTGDAENVVVSDTLPAGVTGIAASGDDWNCSVVGQEASCDRALVPVGTSVIHVTGIAPQVEGPLENVCVISAANESVFDGDCRVTVIIIHGDPLVNVSVQKTGRVLAALDGEEVREVEFEITVTNESAFPVQNVQLQDHWPASLRRLSRTGSSGAAMSGFTCSDDSSGNVSCVAETLAPHATSVLHLAGFTPITGRNQAITNVAEVTATGDSDPSDNRAVATVNIPAGPGDPGDGVKPVPALDVRGMLLLGVFLGLFAMYHQRRRGER